MRAPIILFVYNRLEHTKKTIESLKENTLAKDSELYIFSDGAKNAEQVDRVLEVREYIKKIDGFKSIHIIKSKSNKGLANSVIDGVNKIIEKYGKVIVLEDDLITSKYFLEYMNEALDLYEDRLDIWSISAYTPNIRFKDNYKYEIYLTGRGSSWGWATWKDRWETIDWDLKDYFKFKKSSIERQKFNLSGSDMSFMLDDQMCGRINSWAIRWCYSQFRQNKLTIYPKKSLINNIGNDLSGTHTPITNKYSVKISNEKPLLYRDLKTDKDVLMEFKKFYDLNILGCLGVFIKKLGLYKPARKLRNKLIKIVGVR
ncbi:glycosyltransferase family A protein [Clostridium perfringens]|nr:glycosyltransferase family A protein [Clostridium perfringens]MDK0943045.1 glycosyltransferase family A protein [Clostridium perfringens]